MGLGDNQKCPLCQSGYVDREDMEEVERVLREFVGQLKDMNPYPPEIFRERSGLEWEEFHKVLNGAGISGDGFAGNIGRTVWDNCCDILKRIILD